ncbi:MAG TPA: DUF4286 family protein [Bacteroidales bacterium]|nr:DUF4286 family protein [Bacteroidales bacterium]
MLIVNTTYQVSEDCQSDWILWVKNEYIPEVTKTNLMTHPRFFRLMVENEPGNASYALQFEVKDLDTLEYWFQQYGTNMQQVMSNRFQEKVLGFTTMMETVE